MASDIQLLVARVEGERVGSDPALANIACPYGFDEMELRAAWKNGFEAGKVRRRLGS
jgi:hypothetical protein